MCALNNVGGRVDISLGWQDQVSNKVTECADGQIVVLANSCELSGGMETYVDQAAFAAAYGLDQPAAPVAAASPGSWD